MYGQSIVPIHHAWKSCNGCANCANKIQLVKLLFYPCENLGHFALFSKQKTHGLTRGEVDVFIALFISAGADEKLVAHAFPLLHLTLGVVVVVQQQPMQPQGRVVAYRIHGDVVILLPPVSAKKQLGLDPRPC